MNGVMCIECARILKSRHHTHDSGTTTTTTATTIRTYSILNRINAHSCARAHTHLLSLTLSLSSSLLSPVHHSPLCCRSLSILTANTCFVLCSKGQSYFSLIFFFFFCSVSFGLFIRSVLAKTRIAVYTTSFPIAI